MIKHMIAHGLILFVAGLLLGVAAGSASSQDIAPSRGDAYQVQIACKGQKAMREVVTRLERGILQPSKTILDNCVATRGRVIAVVNEVVKVVTDWEGDEWIVFIPAKNHRDPSVPLPDYYAFSLDSQLIPRRGQGVDGSL